MKLLFIINDGYSKFCEYQHTGIMNAPKRRSIEIELTSEQISKIGLKEIGSSNGEPIYEDIESISLTE